jgi:hypothetical protein
VSGRQSLPFTLFFVIVFLGACDIFALGGSGERSITGARLGVLEQAVKIRLRRIALKIGIDFISSFR